MSIAYSQSGLNTGGSGTAALTLTNAAGSLLVAFLTTTSQSGITLSISDTNLNTWVAIGSPAAVGGSLRTCQMFYAENVASGSNVITGKNATVPVVVGTTLIVAEYTGAATAITALDQIAGPGSGSNNAPSSGNTPATTSTNELLVGCTFNNVATTITATSGISAIRQTNTVQALGDGLTTSEAAYSAVFGMASPGTWVAIAATFLPATFSISGNAGVAGATVSWTGAASGSTTADGSGNYTIPGLQTGSYTITPTLTNWTFAPTNSSQTITTANITGVNFVATQTAAATPTFSPVAGTYTSIQTVTISTTSPSPTIYFTTDGSTPTTGSTMYTVPITVAATATLKAIATSAGLATSAVGSALYTINIATPNRSSRSK